MVNEIELSLELSIGGSYGKSKKLDDADDAEETGLNLGGSGEFDPQAKREIQALRRQEARKKREGKLKKTNGYRSGDGGGGGGGGAEENRVRVRDNEDGGLAVGPASKREKIGNNENVGLVPVGPWQCTNGFVNVYGGVTCWGAIGGNGLQPTGSRSFRPYRNSEQNLGKECGLGNGSSVSPGRSSSAFSDYQSSTLLGGNMSDNASNSSYSQAKAQRRPNASETGHPPEQSEHSGSSRQIESLQAVDSSADSDANMVPLCFPQSGAVKPSEEPKSDTQANPVDKPTPTSSNTNNGVTCRAPRPQPENPETGFRPQMPCVSTTGNGPDGKTIKGFLYRYTKTEVSIVCVCHGSSFTPAEFVEHAGGIDIAHPLRHITVIPSS